MLDIFAINTDSFKRNESAENVSEEVAGIILGIFKELCNYKGLQIEFKVSD